ncbi:MAG: hypothetical protein BZY88_04560 [SAR202 cluster bacterium Io17-Chloro-G9]|nr:MAG: hypothetical protein BZY88_04560 [SAR202 cluster bacterium Io17-Chloro-G9]
MTVDDPEFQTFVEGITQQISDLKAEVIRPETLANYYQTQSPFMLSEDRRTTLITFTMCGDFDDASTSIEEVAVVVDEAQEQDDFKVLLTGQAAFGLDQREMGQADLEKGEIFGVPIAAVILILVLGALVAAVIPLVLAAVSIVVALGVTALIGQAFQFSFFVTNIITMIGLAVGIDYSLFVVARYREERARGLEKIDAIARTGATANRTVLFSGMTVVLALIGMVLIPFNIFISVGAGAIFVVVAAVLAALTLVPAILSLLGDKVNKAPIPWFGRAQVPFETGGARTFWDKVSRGVMAQPIISLILVVGLLVAASIPFFGIHTGFAGISTLPDDIESKQAFQILDEKFSSGEVTPAEILIEGDINSQEVQAGIERLMTAMASDPEQAFATPRPLEVNPAASIALLSVPVAGDTANEASLDAVKRLRSQYIPAAFDGVSAKVHVTGDTAFNIDFFKLSKDSAWVVLPFVLGVSFLLLMLVFRSIVVAVKAVAMNVLAVGAAYGILVLVFQEGVLASTFGFQESPIIEAWIPLFLFTILFGLSMDYHVFLLSRVREHYDQTKDNTESVAFGIRSTGRLITGAALIMVAVFWGFAAGDLVGLQQMGFGLGIAILIDATVVRMILVPSAMRLLGDWNWYLPRWLNWLPDLRVEGTMDATAPAGADD